MDVQVRSAVLLLRRFLPKMAKLPRARVVFVLSSVTRGMPPKFVSMYAVVKHAQLGLMKALASEYAATGLTVNAVSPSMVTTRYLDQLPEVAVQMAAAASPRGRNATPEEVVGAIAFLLSAEADYINGAEIPVTAGSTA
jgi:3-oxoacyl-[acyl-carrier protein] reductase